MAITTSLKRAGLNQAINYALKNPKENLPKLLDWVDKFANGSFERERKGVREVISNPEILTTLLFMIVCFPSIQIQ